ncbi:hypothetical protein N9Z96_00085 [bacterium]|nr:hypothetical protein [bacterium]
MKRILCLLTTLACILPALAQNPREILQQKEAPDFLPRNRAALVSNDAAASQNQTGPNKPTKKQQKPQKVMIDMFIKPLMELICHFMYFNPIKHRNMQKNRRLFSSLVVVGLQVTQANLKNNVNILRAEAWLL